MPNAAMNMFPFADNDKKSPISEEAVNEMSLEHLNLFLPVEPVPAVGFYKNWGHQAWADLFMGKWALKKLSPLVPRTLLPIIKLCAANRQDVTSAYGIILSQREHAKLTDSPRKKWRMAYGNFVRELEWACGELRKYFNKAAYEDLVINATADYIKEALGPVVDSMNNMMVSGHKRLKNNHSKLLKKIIHKGTDFFFGKIINITGWLVGEVKMTEVDMSAGTMVMEVVDCLMLRAPRLKNLPEESCLLGCKGGCEKVFEKGAVRMMLETRLPETTCEIRIAISG